MLLWRALFLVVLGFLSFGGFAQVTTLQVLADLNAAETVDQVAKRPASDFSTLDTARTYPLGFQKALWLRIDIAPALAGASDQGPLVLDFHQPFLDRVNLYSRDTLGSWQIHSAGDWIANAQWQLPGLSPLLKLPTAQMGNSVAYAKITSMVALHVDAQIRILDEAQKIRNDRLLLCCLILGCIALMTALGTVLAVTYRNITYAWYAAYTMASLLATSSYCGVAGYAFWPNSPHWADSSGMAFVMAASLTQLVFSTHLFKPAFVHRQIPMWIARMGIALLLCLPIYTVFTLPHTGWPLVYFEARTAIFISVVAVCYFITLAVAIFALRHMRTIAVLWLLAYVPLLATITLYIVSYFGFASFPWLAFNAPLYALVAEIVILLFALQLHAKNYLSAQLIRRTLSATDPLTGFVTADAFKSSVSRVWNDAMRLKTDASLAYIEVDDANGHYGVGFGLDDDERKRRVVRMLRAGTRPQDIVAVRNDTTFAVIMPGISFSDGLEERLSRLVALGLMVDRKDPHSSIIRFRIAASTQNGFYGKLAELDDQLRGKLSNASNWSKKSICFVWSTNKTVDALDHVESQWQRALGESATLQPGAS